MTMINSMSCYLDEENNIVLEESRGYKHIVLRIESQPGDEGTPDEFYEFATCKSYDLKQQKEPESYNQTFPGLYANYPYLYPLRISLDTRYKILELDLKRRGTAEVPISSSS